MYLYICEYLFNLTLNQNFQIISVPPKPENTQLEIFGLEMNKPAIVAVTIKADPKPSVLWKIGSVEVPEGNTDGRYFVKYTESKVSHLFFTFER